MLQSYKSKSVHVEDNGIFVELARKLAKFFGRVTYCSPWRASFPSSTRTEIGEGMDGIERVSCYEEVLDDTDLFVFPDLYQGFAQTRLVDLGKRVWGARHADEIERFRSDAKHHFEKLAISQGPYEIVRGIQLLRTYLQKKDGQRLWVKINDNRGDAETFKVDGYELMKSQLDDLENRIGPRTAYMDFIVEEDLKDTLDVAIDTFSIDGRYPKTITVGTELKEQCYICARHNWNEMSKNLRDPYNKLSDTLEKYQYRQMLSLESRIRKSEVFLCDPCCRFGSPPSELQMEMIANFPDILWYGAEGNLIEPEIPSRYGVELVLTSDWASEHPLRLDFPNELRDKLKFHFATEFDGATWIMPQREGPRFGVIVEHGNDLDAIIEQIQNDAEQVRGIHVESWAESFPKALEKINQLKEWGVTF